MKKCNKCLQVESKDLFYKRKDQKDGFATICKQCDKDQHSSPEARERKNKARREKHKENSEVRNSKRREQYKNPDVKAKIKEEHAKYYANNKDHVIQKSKKYAENNPDKRKQYSKKHKNNNRESISERQRIYHQANSAKINARIRIWKSENIHLVNASHAQRRASKLQATPSWANQLAIKEIYKLAELKTKETGIPHHVDHYYPLRGKLVSGLHNEFNLQVIPASENLRKSNKYHPDQDTNTKAA